MATIDFRRSKETREKSMSSGQAPWDWLDCSSDGSLVCESSEVGVDTLTVLGTTVTAKQRLF